MPSIMKNTVYTQSDMIKMRTQFFLRAGIVAYPQKLSMRWRAFEQSRLHGKTGIEIAADEGVVPTVVSNALKFVETSLQKPLIEPSNKAIERKRKIYFAHISKHEAEIQKYKAQSEPSVMSTALRNWDIFMRRKIQRPPSSIDEISTVYPTLDSPEIIRIIKTIQGIIGNFTIKDLVEEQDALKEYMGMPYPDIQ